MDVTITLGSEFEEFVTQLVESGEYPTACEVLRHGLYLLKDREMLRLIKRQQLRKDLAVAEDQFKHGQYTTYTAETIHLLTDSIKREGRKRLAAEKKKRNEARTSRIR